MKKPVVFLAQLLILTCMAKSQVIQIDVSAILNARPVTTFTNGRLISWTKGIDGNGAGDGYLTKSAALFNGDSVPHALPDEPVFAADSFHPKIILHYNNNDSTNAQARFVSGEGTFSIAVPSHKYSAMYLCLTSAEGASQLQFQLVYADGTETQDFLLPDYYNDIAASDTNMAYLAHDLAKWGIKNKMTERDHHNIDVVNIHPNQARVLTAVKVSKAKAGYLLFWGAAGVAVE